ncbi:MAG: glycerate kinase, partial [Waterburya sp.]
DYRLSKKWRREAEHRMIAMNNPNLNPEEIDRMIGTRIDDFVEYFWKALHPELFITPLTSTAELVVEIQRDHTLGRIYRPANS